MSKVVNSIKKEKSFPFNGITSPYRFNKRIFKWSIVTGPKYSRVLKTQSAAVVKLTLLDAVVIVIRAIILLPVKYEFDKQAIIPSFEKVELLSSMSKKT